MHNAHIRLVERHSGGTVEVAVMRGDVDEARFWHQRIQPAIRQEAARPDRNWNWPRMVKFYAEADRQLGREPVFLQILAESAAGEPIPVAQILISLGYPFVPDPQNQCGFLWFLARAPKAMLVHYGIPTDIKVMRPLIDVGIQESFNAEHQGRILLHAARTGNDTADRKLFDAYLNEAKLKNYSAFSMRFLLSRRNDGRIFYADELLAVALSKDLDYLR